MGRRLYVGMLALVGFASLGLLALNFRDYPAGNGRDEIAHLQVIEFYQEAHRSPVLPDDLARASEEAHQAPLYYALMAGLIELGLGDPMAEAYQANPFVLTGNYKPEIPQYNRALYVHHWAGGDSSSVRTLHALRVVSVLINVAGLGFVILTMRIIFSRDDARPVVVLALALLTLTPSYWRTAMVINNNHLVFFFGAMSFWLLAKIVRAGVRPRLSVGLGIVLGLGLLSKVFFAPMIVTVGVVYMFVGKRESEGLKPSPTDSTESPLLSGKVILKHLTLITLITLVIAGWWYARNIHLYDDPTATTISEQILDSRRASRLGILEFGEIIVTWPGELWLESWTVLNTRLSLWLASGVGSVLMLSGVMAIVRKRTGLIPGGSLLLIAGFVPALMLAVIGAARNLHGHYSPPLMLVSLPAIAILLTIGALAWVPPRLRGRVSVTGVFIILAGTVVFHAMSFSPLFPRLERAQHIDDFVVENRVDVVFQNGAHLLGYEIENRVLRPGDETRIRLCWGTDVRLDQLFAVTTQLLLDDGSKAAQQDGYPLSGRYPTSAWMPGTVFCEWIPLRVHAATATPRAYDLRVGMYVFHGGDVPYMSGPDSWQNVLLLDKVVIISSDDLAQDETKIVASVDDWGAVTRFEPSLTDDELWLDMAWRARGSSPRRYRVFLHALDATGKLIAQLDREPLDGDFPTDLWIDGLTFADQLHLSLPPETERVIFGVYDPLTGRRGLWTVDGEIVGDSLALR